MKTNTYTSFQKFNANNSLFSFREKKVIFQNRNAPQYSNTYSQEQEQAEINKVPVEPILETQEVTNKVITQQKKLQQNIVINNTHEKIGGVKIVEPKESQKYTQTQLYQNMINSRRNQTNEQHINQNILGELFIDKREKYNESTKHWTEKPLEVTTFAGQKISITHEDFISIFGEDDIFGERDNQEIIDLYSKDIHNLLSYLGKNAIQKNIVSSVNHKLYLSDEMVSILKDEVEKTGGITAPDRFSEHWDRANFSSSDANNTASLADSYLEKNKLTNKEQRAFDSVAMADIAGEKTDGLVAVYETIPKTLLGFNIGSELAQIMDTNAVEYTDDKGRTLEKILYTVNGKPEYRLVFKDTDGKEKGYTLNDKRVRVKSHKARQNVAKSLETLIETTIKKAGVFGQTPEQFLIVKALIIKNGIMRLKKDWEGKSLFSQLFSDNALDEDNAKYYRDAMAFAAGLADLDKIIDRMKGEDLTTEFRKLGLDQAQLNAEAKRNNISPEELALVQKDLTLCLNSPSAATDKFVSNIKKSGWSFAANFENVFQHGYVDENGNRLNGMPKDTTEVSYFDVRTTENVDKGPWYETSRNQISQYQEFRDLPDQVISEITDTVVSDAYTVSDTSTKQRGPVHYSTTSSVIGSHQNTVLGENTYVGSTTQSVTGDKNLESSVKNSTLGAKELVGTTSNTVDNGSTTRTETTKAAVITIVEGSSTTNTTRNYAQQQTDTTTNRYAQGVKTTTTNNFEQNRTTTNIDRVQTIRVGNQDVCTVRTVVTGKDTTVKTITNIKTGEVYEVTTTGVGEERVVTTTRVTKGKKKIVKTRYTAKKPPVRFNITARYDASATRKDGDFETTIGGFGSMTMGSVNKVALGINAKERVHLGESGLYLEGGAGIGFDSARGVLKNTSIGAGFENNHFAIGVAKNFQYFNAMGNQEISSIAINGRIKGEMVDFVVGLGLNPQDKISSMSAVFERNRGFFTKELDKAFQGISNQAALDSLNKQRTAWNKQAITDINSPLVTKHKMDMAGAIVSNALTGGLSSIGVKGDASGVGFILGIITNVDLYKQITGLNPNMFARMENLLFEKGENQTMADFKNINLNKDMRSDYAKSQGKNRYDLFPVEIGKQYVGEARASQMIGRKIVIHGEKNVDIYNDGTFSFKKGVFPHEPQIVNRTMADGTLQIEINFGNNAINASLGNTEEHNAFLGPDGRVQNITGRKLTQEELAENKKILQCLWQDNPQNVPRNVAMKALTYKAMEITPASTNRVMIAPATTTTRVVNGTPQTVTTPAQYVDITPESVKGLIIPAEEAEKVMTDVSSLKRSILELPNTKKISVKLEKYMSKNLTAFTDVNNRSNVRMALQQTFKTLGITIPTSLQDKPLLVYQAVVRARMQEMNRTKNGLGKHKSTPDQKLEFSKQGNFRNKMKSLNFGNSEFNPDLKENAESMTFTAEDMAFGVVQGLKGDATYFPNAATIKVNNVQSYEGKYEGVSGTFYDCLLDECNNASRFFKPDREYRTTESETTYTQPQTETVTTPAKYKTVTTPAKYKKVNGGMITRDQESIGRYGVEVSAANFTLGLGITPAVVKKTVSQTINPFEKKDVVKTKENQTRKEVTERKVRDVIERNVDTTTTTDFNTTVTKGPVTTEEVYRDTSVKDVVTGVTNNVIKTHTIDTTNDTIYSQDVSSETSTINSSVTDSVTDNYIKESRTPIYIPDPVIPDPVIPDPDPPSKAIPIPDPGSTESGGAVPVIDLNNDIKITEPEPKSTIPNPVKPVPTTEVEIPQTQTVINESSETVEMPAPEPTQQVTPVINMPEPTEITDQNAPVESLPIDQPEIKTTAPVPTTTTPEIDLF